MSRENLIAEDVGGAPERANEELLECTTEETSTSLRFVIFYDGDPPRIKACPKEALSFAMLHEALQKIEKENIKELLKEIFSRILRVISAIMKTTL